MSAYIWLVLLTIFQIVDGVTTYLLASSFGTQDELNPIVRYSMECFGLYYGLIIPKVVVMIAAFFLTIKYWYSKIPRVTFKIVTYMYLFIACSNSICIATLGV